MTRIKEIRSRHAGITKGGWRFYFEYLRPQLKGRIIEVQKLDGKPIIHWAGFDALDMTQKQKVANARFIAHANSDISFLLEERERMVAVLRFSQQVRLTGNHLQCIDGTRCELCKRIDALLSGDPATGKA